MYSSSRRRTTRWTRNARRFSSGGSRPDSPPRPGTSSSSQGAGKGAPWDIQPGNVRVIRAPNPGPLTLGGTNTYVVGDTVVDPGPDDDRHLEDVLAVAGLVSRIVLTHRHPDHSAGADRLSDLTGAPVLSFGAGLEDGDRVSGMSAVHTPGHAPDHLCFWYPRERALLSGDLIAGEGSIIIAPPEGDLGAYMASLERVRNLNPSRILPGHGPEV